MEASREMAMSREDHVAKLDAEAIRGLKRGRDANIEVGRAFNQLKKILGHGKWQRHCQQTFAPYGITLRTSENYMRAAREADSKNEKFSNFKSATDRGAQLIRDATGRALAEVGASSGRGVKQASISVERSAVYRLPLKMSGDEMVTCDALQKLPEWPGLEQKIIDLLKHLWIEYGGRTEIRPTGC